MTPIDEFKALLPENHGLTDEQVVFMRDLVDAQSDMILESYIEYKTMDVQNCKNSQ